MLSGPLSEGRVHQRICQEVQKGIRGATLFTVSSSFKSSSINDKILNKLQANILKVQQRTHTFESAFFTVRVESIVYSIHHCELLSPAELRGYG